MDNWIFIPLLIVLTSFQLVIMITALALLLKRPVELVRGGQKWVWALAIIIFNFFGSLAFFIFGKTPEKDITNTPSAP